MPNLLECLIIITFSFFAYLTHSFAHYKRLLDEIEREDKDINL